jgi:hypothetical protein
MQRQFRTQSTRCKTSPVAGRSDAKSLGESADGPFKNIFENFGFFPELRDVFPGEPQIWDIRIQSENDLACFDHVIWRYRRALDAPGSNASRHPCAARETISPGQAVKPHSLSGISSLNVVIVFAYPPNPPLGC